MDWPDGNGGCFQAVVRANDEDEAVFLARIDVLSHAPQIGPLLDRIEARIRKVGQA